MIDLNLNPSKKDLRLFSLASLAFLALVAWVVWHRSGSLAAPSVLVLTGCAIALAGFAAPSVVRPLFIVLMVVNYPIGWLVSHVMMGLIFYLVVTPLAVIMRLLGRDPMERRFDRDAKTYWKPRPAETDSNAIFASFRRKYGRN